MKSQEKTLEVAERYAVRLTPHLEEMLDKAAIAAQFLPTEAELQTAPGELSDPIGDEAHSPVKGIVHRYPDRVLLKPVHVCAAYCRFCFRREMVGPGGEALSAEELDRALAYIRNTPAIWEVILTGGDPLMLSPRRLSALMEKLDKIEHVKIVRIHTRLPVADPEKIDDEMIAALKSRNKTVYVSVHCNHASELTEKTRAALSALSAAGFPLLSQTVLLKGVNNDPQILEALFRALVECRVKPYYLHHCDMAPGTAHFRTTIEEGQDIMRALRGRVSGLCLPEYVLDIPGGHGKVPVGPVYLADDAVKDPSGNKHRR